MCRCVTCRLVSQVCSYRPASHRCVQSNIVLLTQAFRKKFVIPDFQAFCSHIDELYESAKKLSGGQVGTSTDPALPPDGRALAPFGSIAESELKEGHPLIHQW